MAISKGVRKRSIAQARQGFAALVHDVERGATVEVTRRGAPVAFLVSARDYGKKRGAPTFWEALASFRSRNDLAALGGVRELLGGLRDRSPGGGR